jgi:YfiH family protein
LLRKDDRQIYRAIVLEELPWIEHGFGTRAAGDWTTGAATVKQIHSNIVLRADGCGRLGEGDALITDRPGILLAVRTADCIPILLADDRRRAVAAVHAGWRGTVAEVPVKAIESMEQQFGTAAADIWAVIGPGIGECCYQVGPEVADQFRDLMPDNVNDSRIDLVEANRRLLIKAGLRPDRIVAAELCTFCHGSEFHSWRREQSTGRMVSAIGIKGQRHERREPA